MSAFSFHLKILTSSDTPIQLYPTWDYYEKSIINRDFYRGQEGQLNIFEKVGTGNEYFLPFNFVSSSDANNINTWWQNQSNLDFVINSGDATVSSQTVKIVNNLIPFGQHIGGSFNNFIGSIILKTV